MSAKQLIELNLIWKTNEGFWGRKCPYCNSEIVYKSKKSNNNKYKCILNFNKQKNCSKCASKNRKLPEKVNLTGRSSYKTFKYWTSEEENIIKTYSHNLSIEELHLLIPQHSKASLRTKANRLGIKISKELRTKIAKDGRSKITLQDLCFTDLSLTLEQLSNEEYQMLVGSILGDGCCRVHKGCHTQLRNTYAQYYEGHGEAQTEYLKWKMSFFEKFKPRLFIKKDNKPEITTCTHPIFSKIRNLVYTPINRIINGENVVRMEKTFPHPDLINKLDEFGLLIWYLDDGYYGKITRKSGKTYCYPNIAVKSMDIPMINKAVNIINKKFGLNLYVYESKWKNSTNRVIKFNHSDCDIIFHKWRELAIKYNLPKSMWYKLGLNN